MLTLSGGSCKKCGSKCLPFTQQETSVTCKKCDKKFEICNNCKKNGCPVCGGKLESQMDWAAKNDIMF
jgi:DNA-directed RNA polymerase subunit RPC12/RpoP